MADKKITVRISAKDTASRALNRVGSAARRLGPKVRQHVTQAFRHAKIAILGATVAAAGFIKKIIAVGAETETARIRLDSIFGSVEEGAKAFEAVKNAAAQLPFTFSDTLEAASMMGVAVRRTGSDLQTRLMQLAEISARFGIGMREGAAQFQRLALSGAASADMFRERGVNAFLGIEMGARVSAEESLRLWDAAFDRIAEEGSSAVDRLAGTWTGQVSMLQDALRELAQAISDTGLLEFAKNIVTEMTSAVRLFAEAARTDLAVAVEAAFGYLGAKAGEAFFRGLAKPAEMTFDAIIGDNKFGQWLQDRIADMNVFNVAAGFAKKSADEWLSALDILAGRDRLGPVVLPPPPGTGGATGTGTGGGTRSTLPRGGLQPTIGGPGIPLLESLQNGTLPTTLETRHEWRPVLELDTETVRRESMSSIELAFEDVFDDFGKHVGAIGLSVGEDLVTGIIQGTMDMGEVLKRALIGFAARFIMGPLAGALGIFSPSRVTYGFGQNIVQGMVLGMDSMSGPLTAATNRMAGTVTSGLALPRVGGLSGVVGTAPKLTATINTDDTSAHPPWALDWLARGNIELRYAGESI